MPRLQTHNQRQTSDLQGRVAWRQSIVTAIEEAAALFRLCDVKVRMLESSGTAVSAGELLLEGMGKAAGVLKAWKVAQTLVEIWSGVANAAHAIVGAAREVRPSIVVTCTRKNAAGTKSMAIAAIRAGGAVPHRLGLSETILVFPEHERSGAMSFSATSPSRRGAAVSTLFKLKSSIRR